MISIVWKVEKLECIKVFQDKTNVVCIIHYSVTATQDAFNATYVSSRELTLDPNTENFIEYENLTEETVLNWLFASFEENQKTELEEMVTASVIEQAQKPIEELPLPWVNVEPAEEQVYAPETIPNPSNDSVVELGPVFPETITPTEQIN